MLENTIISIGLGIFVAMIFGVVAFKNRPNTIIGVAVLVAISCGFVLKCMKFGNPAKLLYVFTRPSSGFSLEIISLAACVVLAAMFVAKRGSFKGNAFYGAALIISLYALWAQGAVMMLSSRPAWNIVLVPLMYMFSGLIAGGALTAAVYANEGDRRLHLFTGTFSFVMLVLMVAYCGYLAIAPFQHYSRSVLRLVAGDIAWMFWAPAAVYALTGTLIFSVRGAYSRVVVLVLCFLTCSSAAFVIRQMVAAMGTSAQQYIF